MVQYTNVYLFVNHSILLLSSVLYGTLDLDRSIDYRGIPIIRDLAPFKQQHCHLFKTLLVRNHLQFEIDMHYHAFSAMFSWLQNLTVIDLPYNRDCKSVFEILRRSSVKVYLKYLLCIYINSSLARHDIKIMDSELTEDNFITCYRLHKSITHLKLNCHKLMEYLDKLPCFPKLAIYSSIIVRTQNK